MYTLEHNQSLSPTAVICENLQRFGGTPQKGEPDPRAVWDRDEALAGLDTILDTFVDEIAPDGTQFADERESLLWGFVNTLHMQTVRLDRAVDRLSPELKQLQRSQDGTEINAWELERIIERARNLGDRRDAFEQLRDAAAERYRSDTGNTWRPRHGSHISRTAQLTSAAIDARDFLRARENEKTQAHLPQGTLVAVAGSKPVDDANPICATLDQVRGKYKDMVLVHGGGPGAEKIAARWAESRGVHQVVCKPDWNAHGKAAPFRRNDQLLKLLPKGVIGFPGSGVTENLLDKAVPARHSGPSRYVELGITRRINLAGRVPSSGLGPQRGSTTAAARSSADSPRRPPIGSGPGTAFPFVRYPGSSPFRTREWLDLAECGAFGAALRGGSAAHPTLTLLSALMLTPIPMLRTAVRMIDLDSPLHPVYPGASLRDRATLPSPLRGLDPAGGYPSRLRSLRSLRAPVSFQTSLD